MSWIEEVLGRLQDVDGFEQARARLDEALPRIRDADGLKEILGAASLLSRAAALNDRVILPALARALEALEALRGPDAECLVIALGDTGRSCLSVLSSLRRPGASPRAFAIDLETSRIHATTPDVERILLGFVREGELDSAPTYGRLLQDAYHAGSAPSGLPPAIAEAIASSDSAYITTHIVCGIEDAWVCVLPELLRGLKNALGKGPRGTILVHLLSRASPRLRSGQIEALDELEATRPFHQAYLLCGDETALARRVVDFIHLATCAPEILLDQESRRRRGPFSTYGIALAESGEASSDLKNLNESFEMADPACFPSAQVLLDADCERAFVLHPPSQPPPEGMWRLVPEITAVPAEGVSTTFCRIQRGLRRSDIKLG
ncbi:MAG TPA: hypothetical protein VFD71_19775 [Planctomycetota bacterium]|nr:hypothetical protein [Planctomycetota bacterium]